MRLDSIHETSILPSPQQAGHHEETERAWREAPGRRPRHFIEAHQLSVDAHLLGRHQQAIELSRRAIALNPDYAPAHNTLGNALKGDGQVHAAIGAYRQAISLDGNYAEAFCNLGSILSDSGQLDEAVLLCRKVIATRPQYAEAHNILGIALDKQGQRGEAIVAFREAIRLRPDFSHAHNNLGMRLKDSGQLPDAIVAYRQAIAVRPAYAEAHSNLGNALREIGQLEDAIASYRQAIILKPDLAEAHNNLGVALNEQGKLECAVAAFEQATVLKPNYAGAYGNLGAALNGQGKLDKAIGAYRAAIALNPNFLKARDNLVYSIHFHPEYDAQKIAEEHARWNRQHAEPLRRFIKPHSNNRDPNRRLRIGYVSPDLREHVVGRFLRPLLAHHDKKQVEVFAYSQAPATDAMTQRLRACTDGWRNIVGLSDQEAADLIRHDQIDILVDLAMHMSNNRLLVFARKPAPVQMTYLAYCSTTGLKTMDYRLSDPYLDPPGEDESIYSEKTIRLPQTYWCYEPSSGPPEVDSFPALAQGVTFGCLNNFSKVNKSTLSAWTEILRGVPNSRLLLHVREGAHQQRVLDKLEEDGIDRKRVRLVGFLPTRKYLDLYREIDIALDTFPYAGGTTTCVALWMGAPVVSLVGKTAVGRGGLSILSNIGLRELVAFSQEQYVRIAIALGNDLPRLGNIRSTLRRRMQQSPLMDAPNFARNIEAAYRIMWRTWCETSPQVQVTDPLGDFLRDCRYRIGLLDRPIKLPARYPRT